MLLNGRRISQRLRLESGVAFKDRLIITPVLDRANQLKDDSASIDVRLGQKFVVPKRTKVSHLDHIDKDQPAGVIL